MSEDEQQALQTACERVLLNEPYDAEAAGLLTAFSLGSIVRILDHAGHHNEQEADLIGRALSKALVTSRGLEALPTFALAAGGALEHPSPIIRRLGCTIMSLYIPRAPGAREAVEAASRTLTAMEDPDTGVAVSAGEAITTLVHHEQYLLQFLGRDGALPNLMQLVSHQDSTVRFRSLGLIVDLASKSRSAADAITSSGLLEPFAGDLRNADDLLACMAAMQLLTELATTRTMPPTIAMQLLDNIHAMLKSDTDSSLHSGALLASARLLSHMTAEEQSPEATNHLNECLQLLAMVCYHEANDVDLEHSALDAVSTLCTSAAARSRVLESSIFNHVAKRALGRATPPPIRTAALQALAGVAGYHDVHGADSSSAVGMSEEAEKRLKTMIYEEAVPETNVALGPAQALWESLRTPFPDLKVAAYCAATACAARTWFASEVCQHEEFWKHLCDPLSESGDACKWRYGLIMVLSQVAEASQACIQAGSGGPMDALLAAKADAIRRLKAAGIYGRADTSAEEAIPDVAVATQL